MKEKLIKLIKYCRSDYFNFPVVAILECKDGTLINGVNVETSSPQAGICAERNAIYSAFANGYKQDDFKALHIMSASCEIVYPCMICRQALVDFCPKTMDIVLYDADSDNVIHKTVDDLVSCGFSKDDLR